MKKWFFDNERIRGKCQFFKNPHTNIVSLRFYRGILLPNLASIFTSIKFVTAQISKEHTTK